MIREAMDNADSGISVGGRVVNTIRYADHKAVVANSQIGLQQLIINLNKVTQKFGMKINVKKTKWCVLVKTKLKVKMV